MQDGATLLFIAAENGHLEVVQNLVSGGADKDKARTVSCGLALIIDMYDARA